MSKKSNVDVAEVTAVSAGAGGVTASAAALLGADLVVAALAWDNLPSEGGIVTIIFFMMISFVVFIHVMHQIMRYEYLVSHLKLKGLKEKDREKYSRELNQISKWVRYFHVGGLLFTMIAFWIISYKYLISLAGYHIPILLLPFILFVLYWIPKIIGVEREVTLLARESLIQLVIQIVFLVLICLDFLRILTIP